MPQGILLSDSELLSFVREGYVIKRDVLDPRLLDQARKLYLRHQAAAEPAVFDKALKAEPVLLNLVAQRCRPAAEQLLGRGNLVLPSPLPADPRGPKDSGGDSSIGQHLRAVVNRLPSPPTSPRRPTSRGLHFDAHPFSVGVVAYLNTILPGSGEFCVFPRSHTRAFHRFPWQYSSRFPDHSAIAGDGGNTGVVKDLVTAIQADTVPVALHGDAGTVIFFHHRLGHTGGPNLSAAGGGEPGRDRLAVFYDFVLVPKLLRLGGEAVAIAGQPSENGDGAPPVDMWRDWSVSVRAAAASSDGGGECYARL